VVTRYGERWKPLSAPWQRYLLLRVKCHGARPALALAIWRVDGRRAAAIE
jgi:hypothetical protein